MDIRTTLLLGILVIIFPLILKKPHYGVLAWAWVSYMNPHRLTWNATEIPIAMMIAVLTLISLFTHWKELQNKVPITLVSVTLFLFCLWFTLTTYYSVYPALAWASWDRAIKIQIFIFLTLFLIQDKQRIHQLIWVIVFSLGFFGVKGGIFTLLTGGQYMVLGPLNSFISDNNTIGFALIITIPLIYYLQQIETRKWLKICLLFAFILTIIASIGTQSRGAFLSIAVMGLFLLVKSKHKIMIVFISIIIIFLVIMYMPEQYFDRMNTIQTFEQDSSAMGRINSWLFAINIANVYPIFGGGFEIFHPDLFLLYAPNPDMYHDAHSIYFEILAEQGYIGLLLFLLLALFGWRTGTSIIYSINLNPRADLQWAKQLAQALQVSLIGYFFGGIFLGLAYFDLYYHLLSLLVLTQMHVNKTLKTDEATTLQEIQINDNKSIFS